MRYSENLKRENIELINDGEYGLYEGTCDNKPTLDEIINFMKSENIIVDEPVIFFDEFQGFYRFRGSISK